MSEISKTPVVPVSIYFIGVGVSGATGFGGIFLSWIGAAVNIFKGP